METLPKPPLKERLKSMLEQYGRVAIATYFVIFALSIIGFAIAIQLGVKVEGTAGTAGLLGAAWVATKVIQPLRIIGTLALTPIIAKLLERWRGNAPRPS
jgi:hypothetical protein